MPDIECLPARSGSIPLSRSSATSPATPLPPESESPTTSAPGLRVMTDRTSGGVAHRSFEPDPEIGEHGEPNAGRVGFRMVSDMRQDSPSGP